MLADLKIAQPGETQQPPAEQPKEEKPPETPKETPQPPAEEPKPETKSDNPFDQVRGNREPKSEKAQENFKKLQEARDQERKNREAAEARAKELETQFQTREQELQQLRQQLEEAKKQPQIPENFQSEFQKQQQLIQQLQTELRAASIERDPEFVERYQKGKEQQVSRLQEFAGLAGVTPEEFNRALKYGDEDKLAEIKDSLTPGQRYQWDAVRSRIAALDIEREEAVTNSHKTWEQLQKQREEQFHRQREQSVQANLALAREIEEDFRAKAPLLNEKPELAQQMQGILTALAGGKGAEQWDPKRIMGSVATIPILVHRIEEQNKLVEEIPTLQKQVEEKDAKIKELEDFIKQRHGGTGESYSGGGNTKPTSGYDETKPLWKQIEELAR
jgi:hypothetical protein